MLVSFITVVHVLVCVFMILVILLQAGKDAGMGAAFGGGSGTVFGGRGAGSFLGKVTAVCAAIFFMTSLTLSFAAHRGSVAEQYAPTPTEAPGAPAAPATGSAPAPATGTAPTQGTEPAKPTDIPAAPAAPAAPAPEAPAAPANP